MNRQVPYYQRRLREELATRQGNNSSYSLRSFARSLDLSSGAVAQLLSGKRIPSSRTVKRLLAGLSLEPEEAREFLTSLDQIQKGRGLQRRRKSISVVAEGEALLGQTVRERRRIEKVSLDHFQVIADWYHYALLELTYLDSFQTDANWRPRADDWRTPPPSKTDFGKKHRESGKYSDRQAQSHINDNGDRPRVAARSQTPDGKVYPRAL